MTISAVLAGSDNDARVLKSVLMMAARDGYEVKVILGARFPKAGFLTLLDSALSRVALAGLAPPTVAVERRRDGLAAPATDSREPLRFPVEQPSVLADHSRSMRSR